MKETIDNKTISNEAAKTALVFAAVTITRYLLKRGLDALDPPTVILMLLSGVLWAIEFAGCIWLMIFFMRKLVKAYDGVTNSDTNKYGRRIALFSAILIAAVDFLILYFSPMEKQQEGIDALMEIYTKMPMDSDSLSSIEELLQNHFPVITFLSDFLHCFLYGVILSAILSRMIPSQKIFAPENTFTEP